MGPVTASVRYFSLFDGTCQVSSDYFRAFAATGLPLRAIPITGMLSVDARGASTLPPDLQRYFLGAVGTPYVNVVDAPLGIMRGAVIPAGRFGIDKGAMKDEVVYRPEAAFVALYTVGVPNVAIVQMPPAGQPLRPAPGEAEALARYQAIVVPDHASALSLLVMIGKRDFHVIPPADTDRLRDLMTSLVQGGGGAVVS